MTSDFTSELFMKLLLQTLVSCLVRDFLQHIYLSFNRDLLIREVLYGAQDFIMSRDQKKCEFNLVLRMLQVGPKKLMIQRNWARPRISLTIR